MGADGQIDRRALLVGLGGCALAGARPALARGRRPAALSPEDFTPVLAGIDGAEGIAIAPDGTLAFSTRRAAVGLLRPGKAGPEWIGAPLATGRVAFDRQGRLLVANVSALHGLPGPLRRIDPATGAVETLVTEVEGRALVTSNCPTAARDGTVYCSHTGWSVCNIGTTSAEGFVYAVLPGGEVRVVARNLRGVNGLCLDAAERHLYAALTAEGRVVRWRRRRDGTLGPREDYGPVLGEVFPDQKAAEVRALPGDARARTGYCDGVGFDRRGNLWVTLPFANRLVAITQTRALVRVLHDPDGARVRFPTNLAFGGADGRTLHVVARDAGAIVEARVAYA